MLLKGGQMNLAACKVNLFFSQSLILLFISIQYATAAITTDGTLGPAKSLTGPNYTITEQLGSRAGTNLYHSFQQFSVHSGETAHFTGSADIKNVISRVTGGSSSTINGVLSSDIGSQGFYLINPAGIVFGADASINVPASFHASTADYLLSSDGSRFDVKNPQNSQISIAEPQTFDSDPFGS